MVLASNTILALLNWFYPKKCNLCQTNLNYLDINYLCKPCLERINRFKFNNQEDFIYSAGPFEGSLRELIHSFKYKGKDYLSSELSKLLLPLWLENPTLKNCDFILPIPLYPLQERDRGYNQSALLAKDFYWSLQKNKDNLLKPMELLEDQLYKTKKTCSQTKLSKEERQKNVAGVFTLKDPLKIKGKQILLIDDVSTTGATLQSARQLLLESGAKEVFALTLARD